MENTCLSTLVQDWFWKTYLTSRGELKSVSEPPNLRFWREGHPRPPYKAPAFSMYKSILPPPFTKSEPQPCTRSGFSPNRSLIALGWQRRKNTIWGLEIKEICNVQHVTAKRKWDMILFFLADEILNIASFFITAPCIWQDKQQIPALAEYGQLQCYQLWWQL